MGVRWDAVVDCSRFRSAPARPASMPAASIEASVQVWLFGSLAEAIPERPVNLQIRNPFSIGDVIAELGHRCGGTFLSRITDPDGGVLRHCRVFVNGEAVEDTGAPVCANDAVAQIEMILLTAAEGG